MFEAGIDAASDLLTRSDMREAATLVKCIRNKVKPPVTPYRVIGVVCEVTGTDENELLSGSPSQHLSPFRGLAICMIEEHVDLRATAIADLFGVTRRQAAYESALALRRVQTYRTWRDLHAKACQELGVEHK